MIHFTCVALYSLDDLGRGFLFPAFSRDGSNEIFFQDLSVDGRVERFLKVDTAKLFPVPIYPPALKLSIGDMGLLAFLDDAGELEIGVPIAVAHAVNSDFVTDPITLIELASLKADRSMQKRAIRECDGLFAEGAQFARWAKREKRLFRQVMSEGRGKPDETELQNARLEGEFRNIESQLADPEWSAKWLRLWGQDFERRRLIGIAYLKQDSGYEFGHEAPEIFRLIVDIDKSLDAFDRATQILSSSLFESSGWYQLFIKLYYRWGGNRDKVIRIAIEKLRQSLIEIKGPNRSWMSTWEILAREASSRDEVFRLGAAYIHHLSYVSMATARTILRPLTRSPQYLDLIYEDAVTWLSNFMRSDTIWAAVFLNTFRSRPNEHLEQLGLRWLDLLGGNLSYWVEIWRLFKDRISRELYVDLAKSWLARARKDMKSWVDVYFELFEMPGMKDDESFIRLGLSWLESYQGNVANRRKMMQALKYLQSRFEKAGEG